MTRRFQFVIVAFSSAIVALLLLVSALLAGSDRGGERAAMMYTLIQTARLNDVDPQAWLADVLARINDHNIRKLEQLLPPLHCQIAVSACNLYPCQNYQTSPPTSPRSNLAS